MPRVVFEKLATLQLLDVRVPTTDERELLLVRRAEPDHDVALLLARLNLTLPPQRTLPFIAAAGAFPTDSAPARAANCEAQLAQ